MFSEVKPETCIYADLPFFSGHTRFVAAERRRVFIWGRAHRTAISPSNNLKM